MSGQWLEFMVGAIACAGAPHLAARLANEVRARALVVYDHPEDTEPGTRCVQVILLSGAAAKAEDVETATIDESWWASASSSQQQQQHTEPALLVYANRFLLDTFHIPDVSARALLVLRQRLQTGRRASESCPGYVTACHAMPALRFQPGLQAPTPQQEAAARPLILDPLHQVSRPHVTPQDVCIAYEFIGRARASRLDPTTVVAEAEYDAVAAALCVGTHCGSILAAAHIHLNINTARPLPAHVQTAEDVIQAVLRRDDSICLNHVSMYAQQEFLQWVEAHNVEGLRLFRRALRTPGLVRLPDMDWFRAIATRLGLEASAQGGAKHKV